MPCLITALKSLKRLREEKNKQQNKQENIFYGKYLAPKFKST